MKDRPRTQDFDWVLLAIVAAITTLGVLEIYSSTHASAMAGMQWKQLMWLGLGVVGMFIISRIDYHTLMDQAPVLYMIGLGTLLVVLAIGQSRFGAKRWVSLGGGPNFQVSELMKLIIIIVLARFFSEVRTDRLTLPDLAKVAILTIDSGRPNFNAAGSWYSDGACSRRGGRRISRRHRMETSSHRLRVDRADDSTGVEHEKALEAVPAAKD